MLSHLAGIGIFRRANPGLFTTRLLQAVEVAANRDHVFSFLRRVGDKEAGCIT